MYVRALRSFVMSSDNVRLSYVLSQWTFTVISLFSLPLYILTITVCIKEWKHNHLQRAFHLLIITQGFVDIVVVVNYFFFWTLRVLHLFNDFYWRYQNLYMPIWCFIQTYISVIMRCFGVLLISLQRYLSVCRTGTRCEQFVNVSHRWALPILQWIVPLLYSIPLFTLNDVKFDTRENLELVADKYDVAIAASMTIFFVCVTFVLCSLCYGAILRFLLKNRYNNSVAMKREFRLCAQMLGLFGAFTLLFIFNIMLFCFSLYNNNGSVIKMRIIFPIISCLLSYVNPWMMFILNYDIRKKILHIILCKKK